MRGVSARELEACRRELEEESSRQRQHFLEEVELLKVQSEERLQDRINQLKVKKMLISDQDKDDGVGRSKASFCIRSFISVEAAMLPAYNHSFYVKIS